jgi:hypothetical protein
VWDVIGIQDKRGEEPKRWKIRKQRKIKREEQKTCKMTTGSGKATMDAELQSYPTVSAQTSGTDDSESTWTHSGRTRRL